MNNNQNNLYTIVWNLGQTRRTQSYVYRPIQAVQLVLIDIIGKGIHSKHKTITPPEILILYYKKMFTYTTFDDVVYLIIRIRVLLVFTYI